MIAAPYFYPTLSSGSEEFLLAEGGAGWCGHVCVCARVVYPKAALCSLFYSAKIIVL